MRMTADELNALVGKRARLWLDKARTRSIVGIVKTNGPGRWYIPDPGRRGSFLLNPRRDVEPMD
jgi:hypothetical protein